MNLGESFVTVPKKGKCFGKTDFGLVFEGKNPCEQGMDE